MTEPLHLALTLAANGYYVLPVGPNKIPLTPHGFHDSSQDPEVIATWFSVDYPNAPLVGIDNGRSNVVVLDIDVHGSETGFDSLGERGLTPPDTITYSTRSGGAHYVYRDTSETGLAREITYDGMRHVDRCAGLGYTIWWGSLEQAALPPAPAPEWLTRPRPVAPPSGAFDGAVGEWVELCAKGPISGQVAAVVASIPQTDFGHAELIALQRQIVGRGADGDAGIALALSALKTAWLRGEYDTPENRREFDISLEGAVSKFGAFEPWAFVPAMEAQFGALPEQTADAPIDESLLRDARDILRREQVQQLAEEMRTSPPLQILTRADLELIKPSAPLVDGWLYSNTVATLAATGGVGKTAIALDWALCMGTNETWLDHEVAQGEVLFIEAEGFANLDKRIRAWDIHHGYEPGTTGGNIHFVPGATLNVPTLRQIEKRIRSSQYRLVIIDTFASSFAVKSENDNAEVSGIYRELKRLRDCGPEVTILLIAHTTESTDARGNRSSKHRGASAFRDDSDTLIIGAGNRDSFTLSTDAGRHGKQRDAEERTTPDLHLMRVGGHVVVAELSDDDAMARDEKVKERVARLTPNQEYKSSEMKTALGYRSDKEFNACRQRALELGLIRKNGESNKAPYIRLVWDSPGV
ncbi:MULTISPECIES: AAA family ATPase [unclassified Frondihabitans]|uniref:AAA family ATPase n=1 Tax=unclassified Frondihabitans TaxID=2626248 RepID=UPI000F505836|nr:MULTISPECIES: AAA family ATPase [unclassified Frondihabitans]RPE75208.1 bifunctional DNA primase/polymerase-like protein [Frondihabitans sp. PhB153]RPF04450.1 bifunctional DNA primase/polymerase-like protein [Frondihabitans sp. PhB161]